MIKDIGTWIEIASFLILFIGAIAGGVWRVSVIVQSVREDIDTERDKLLQRLDREAHNFDETLRGLREKINQVQLETERNFVTKMAFGAVVSDIAADIKELGRDLRERLGRMEDKIDHVSVQRDH